MIALMELELTTDQLLQLAEAARNSRESIDAIVTRIVAESLLEDEINAVAAANATGLPWEEMPPIVTHASHRSPPAATVAPYPTAPLPANG